MKPERWPSGNEEETMLLVCALKDKVTGTNGDNLQNIAVQDVQAEFPGDQSGVRKS